MKRTQEYTALGYETLEDFMQVNQNVVLILIRNPEVKQIEVTDADDEEAMIVISPQLRHEIADYLDDTLSEWFNY